MTRISDVIENFIKQMLEENHKDVLEIQRNELANVFKCAPSQINYVLTTRFTVDRGYYIESKRGGGGCIKISRINMNNNELRENIWNNIGDRISQKEAETYIDAFLEHDYIGIREAKIMKSAINDKTLIVPEHIKDYLRSQILKTMLIAIV